jgi:hypothetical protein
MAWNQDGQRVPPYSCTYSTDGQGLANTPGQLAIGHCFPRPEPLQFLPDRELKWGATHKD